MHAQTNKTPTKIAKILIADDHELIRQALTLLLTKEEHLQIIGEASNGQEALDFLAQNPTDIILLDIDMPVLNGVKVSEQIRTQYPNLKIIILTAFTEPEVIFYLLHLGIHAYVLKQNSFTELSVAIRLIRLGGRFFSAELIDAMADHIETLQNPHSSAQNKKLGSEESNDDFFSHREMEILIELANGLNNTEIGHKLGISVHTVDTHRRNMFKKAKVKTSASLVSFAKDRHII